MEAFSWVLTTYGKQVEIKSAEGNVIDTGLCVIQPMTKNDLQYVKELGSEVEEGQFLGLCNPELSVDNEGSYLSAEDKNYDIQCTKPIWVGGSITHIWMSLKLRS